LGILKLTLSPNGAGKSTFFSLMTGVYRPTSGNAYVRGYSITDNIDKVQEIIGYCPQFDLLWNDLSVEEHLYLYSRLKCVQEDLIKTNVNKTLEATKLKKYKKFLVKELSGGMKRRLSVGISLVGDPSIVFLDEPSTGLDPDNKRQIWEILASCKQDKCMILTTHLMEEAEVLTDRIGIIANGTLRCLGSQYKLRNKFGGGFKLTVNLLGYNLTTRMKPEELFVEERNGKIVEFVGELFPSSILYECYKNTLSFKVI
jgi:ABC-type multidrug transport system ATPase subunit